MKPFNLEEALAGKLVQVRNGKKAIVLGALPSNVKTKYPLIGVIFQDEINGGFLVSQKAEWTMEGWCLFNDDGKNPSGEDIIGMWEEPIKYRHINGRKFPEPCSEPLKDGQLYFTINFDVGAEVVHFSWDDDDDYDNNRLKMGIVHATQEAAQAHADAINSLFSGEVWHEPSVDSFVVEPQMSKRGEEWVAFSAKVLAHIEDYTVPQYGDAPNDSITAWSDAACVEQIGKYAARYGKNAREGQEQLDLLKMAHYACLAFHKQN